MADYLQDLLDRMSAYSDPSQYPQTPFDPYLTDEENKKKKKEPEAVLPQAMQQAGLLPGEQGPSPLIDQIKQLYQQNKQAYATSPQVQGPNLLDYMRQNFAAAGQAAPYAAGQEPGTPAMLRKAAAAPAQSQLPPLSQTSYGVGAFPPQPEPPQQPQPQVPEPPASDRSADTESERLGRVPMSAAAAPQQGVQRDVDGSQAPPENRPGAQPTDTPPASVMGGPAGGPQAAASRSDIPRNVVLDASQRAGMMGGDGQDFGSKIMQGLHEHSNMLLALGAGLMGAPNVWQGMGRGFANAIPAIQQDIRMQTQQGSQQAMYNAFRAAGAPHDLAIAGATNPEFGKQLMEQYVSGQKYDIKEVKSKDFFGRESTELVAVNPRDPRDNYSMRTGRPYGGDASGGTKVGSVNAQGQVMPSAGAGGSAPPADASEAAFFAPGVNEDNFDHTKSGADYIAQFSPEVQADIKNRTMGVPPSSGASRGRAEVNAFIQRAAEKYGEDMGLPMDSVSMGQRRVWANSLADTKNGIGLQAKGFQTGLEHLDALTEKWVKAHQGGGMGIEPLARLENIPITSEQTAVYNGIRNDAGKVAGEVGKLWSSGGTGRERKETEDLLGDTRMSKIAAAGAIESTLDLMRRGLLPLERRRDELFPQGMAPRGSEFIGKEEQAHIANIQKNLAILKGQRPAEGNVPAAPPPGNYRWDPNTGKMVPAQ